MPNTNYLNKAVRASAILTDAYVAGTVLADMEKFNQLILEVSFTIGSLTSAEVKVEYSQDGTTYYQDTNKSISSGTSTLYLANYTFSATGNYQIEVPIVARFIKVSVKGTGTVTNSLMAVNARMSYV